MNIDQVNTSAINGVPVDGLLADLHSSYREPLVEQRNALQNQCNEAIKLQSSLEIVDQPQIDPAATEANVTISSAAMKLKDAQESYDRADKVYRAFQHRHSLPRDAAEPFVLLNVMVFIIMVSVEGVINAVFLQNSHMVASPSKALITSILFSLANIVASSSGGFFIGRFLKYGANAIDKDAIEFKKKRRNARVQLIIFIFVMAGFHLNIGLIRSEGELDLLEHSFEAYALLLSTPESLLIMLIGGCLSVVAYHKGLTSFADSYPYFSTFAKARNVARDELLEQKEMAGEVVADIFDVVIDSSNKAQKTRNKQQQACNELLNNCKATHAQLNKHISDAETNIAKDTAIVFDIYRSHGQPIDPDFDMRSHISFSSVMDGFELPLPVPKADFSRTIEKLSEAKARALERLGQVFSETINSSSTHQEN